MECGHDASKVCDHDGVNDLRGEVDLRCDVYHGGEDDDPIGMVARWVEDEDAEELEKEDFCPWISTHFRTTVWVCREARTRKGRNAFISVEYPSEWTTLYCVDVEWSERPEHRTVSQRKRCHSRSSFPIESFHLPFRLFKKDVPSSIPGDG